MMAIVCWEGKKKKFLKCVCVCESDGVGWWGKGDADSVSFSMRNLPRPVIWLGNYTECVITAMSEVVVLCYLTCSLERSVRMDGIRVQDVLKEYNGPRYEIETRLMPMRINSPTSWVYLGSILSRIKLEEKRRTKCEREWRTRKKIFGVLYHPNPTAVFF
uniref:Probable inactive ATP-dependent zinc metalloprotease FTSHI 1, chloroplastic n=1 Tax=Tanacetum cinerariifolium TaxID=118510 RepID=A0A699HFS1_TANCI|nr:probable inactive ATP-dependent zinc metalloprotease FTSHI 1, chloroplastic [Tanacetum cinerariifolium]